MKSEFSVQVANVDELDREILATVVALLSDPAMAAPCRLFRRGAAVIRVDQGEVCIAPMTSTPKAGGVS